MRHPILCLALALALAGCAPQALVPTPTPAPTATPTPAPSPTPQPSPTPAPDVAATLRAGIDRSARADTYRMEVALTGSGALGGVQLGDAEVEVLAMSGEFAGESYRFALRGFLASFLGADPQRGLEASQVDGVRYVRGPLAFMGAPDPVWYRLSVAQGALASPPITAATTLALLRDSGADFSGFTPDGEDRVGDQRCAVYRGDRAATVALVTSLAQGGLPTADPASVAEAETRLIVCPDGYLHRVEMSFSGAQPAEAASAAPEPYSYRLNAELSDFDAQIALDAPGDAVDLPAGPAAPGLPLPTVSP